MRRVARPPAPAVLEGAESVGGRERKKAIEFFAKPENAEKTFNTFAAYKHEAVKEALDVAFAHKCAYCESQIGQTQPLDVEHYRPKSGYLEGKELKKPGYYWLAATWENLLPSCIDCNRERKQIVEGTRRLSGKESQFPIVAGSKRATQPGGEKNEKRLLLHPYLDRPERHLVYKDDGIVGWARPGARPSKKGEQSILVYGLLRIGLVRARAEVQSRVKRQLVFATRAAERLDANPTDPGLRDELQLHIEELESLRAPGAPFSDMARQMIEPFLKRVLPD